MVLQKFYIKWFTCLFFQQQPDYLQQVYVQFKAKGQKIEDRGKTFFKNSASNIKVELHKTIP